MRLSVPLLTFLLPLDKYLWGSLWHSRRGIRLDPCNLASTQFPFFPVTSPLINPLNISGIILAVRNINILGMSPRVK